MLGGRRVFFKLSVTNPPRGHPFGGGGYGFVSETRPVRISPGIFSGQASHPMGNCMSLYLIHWLRLFCDLLKSETLHTDNQPFYVCSVGGWHTEDYLYLVRERAGCIEWLDYLAQKTQYNQTYSPNKEQQSKNITKITGRCNKKYSNDHTQNTN